MLLKVILKFKAVDLHSFFADPDPDVFLSALQNCGVTLNFVKNTLWRVCCDWIWTPSTFGFLVTFYFHFNWIYFFNWIQCRRHVCTLVPEYCIFSNTEILGHWAEGGNRGAVLYHCSCYAANTLFSTWKSAPSGGGVRPRGTSGTRAPHHTGWCA